MKGLKKNAKNIESNDSNEDDSSGSEEEIEYDETQPSSHLKCNDIAVIRTGNDFPYYFLKLNKNPFLTNGMLKMTVVRHFPQ